MSLVKIPFLVAGAVGGYVVMTAPNAKVPVEQRAKGVSAFERFFSATARLYTLGFKALILSGSILEVLVIGASHFPAHPLSQKILDALVVGPYSLTRRITISPLFVAGAAIGYFGAYFRWQCYRTLGRLFTFEVSIREGHKLITAGPYQYTRHPAYTGSILSTIGLGLMYIAPGSWIRECGILATRGGKIAAWTYVAAFLYGSASLFQRAPQEDVVLKKHFGEEWEAYAKRVPYRIFPFIY
ncbi:uncharacterized protein C8Q71DRAFT_116959 [Rhodofomes roseus]|uniref:Protein-S-isoprenylcysteine O-methyltransferase n=1 Tax=Rhodofomes roseus TaxID=34475 RepID=A0A4Y9YXU0_9APHY|nr:uncharacterized protein C8Q71DRAFT_116959 [Rhodofomes roseus]KAH9835371.1 hypothetical protein C8Q71DRAFT_116959 [Rhodofomes roseus]TFY67175.1 hypothetical protein EVJ58_g1790 [Rhodofomes roseus]